MDDEQYRREYGEHLIEQVKNGTMTRRDLLIRASVFGFSATAAGRLLASLPGSTASAAAPSVDTRAPVLGGKLKVVIPPPIKSIDPVTIYDQGGIVLAYQFTEYLIDVTNTNALKPKLAVSWTPNKKGDVWTFKLRQNVKWNNGKPFEAADVVASIERVLNPAKGSGALAALKGILSHGGTTAVDKHTVRFHLDKPFADFPYLVSSASYNTAMLPRNYGGDFVKSPVGTGPFMLKQYVVGQRCVAVKNPHYWGKDAAGRQLPYLNEVDFSLIQSDQAAVLALQSGAVDVQAQTVFASAQPLLHDPNLRVDRYPSTGIREVAFNVTKDPWADKRLRQAVAYCLDRPAINMALYGGKSNLGYDTFWEPTVYPGSPTPPVRSMNIAKAKSLLAAAGKSSLNITLTTSQYLENPQYAQLIQAQCKPAGINVTLNIMSYDNYYAGDNSNTPWLNAAMTMTEWGSRPAPGQFAQAMLLPTSAWSSSHWNSPSFLSTFNQYESTADMATRTKLAKKLSAIQQDQTPVVVAFFISQLRTQKKTVHGINGPGSYYFDVSQAYITK